MALGLWESSEAHLGCLRPAPPGSAFWMKSLSFLGCVSFPTCLGNPDSYVKRVEEAVDADGLPPGSDSCELLSVSVPQREAQSGWSVQLVLLGTWHTAVLPHTLPSPTRLGAPRVGVCASDRAVPRTSWHVPASVGGQ